MTTTTKATNNRLRAEVAAIEKSLVTESWIPNRFELKLGNAFFTCSKQLDEDRRPAHLPAPQDMFDCWRTHYLTYHARLTEASEHLLSALWVRLLLRRSPMRRLVAAYVEAGQQLLPYTERILAAWRSTPPVLDTERLDDYIAGNGLPAAEAKDRIWRATIKEWEEEQLPTAEFEGLLDPAERVMSGAATVMVAAVTGEITY